jgi:dienelactone hydrolase
MFWEDSMYSREFLLPIFTVVYLSIGLFEATTPKKAHAKSLISFKSVEIPVSKFKAKRGGKPSRLTYYVYHFKPKDNRPSPYLIYIPSSTIEVFGGNHLRVKNARRMAGYGYGVIVIDINRNVKGTKEVNGYVPAPSRAIGALSAIQYIIDKYPSLSNGKFGAWGHSKGGSTTIEINKLENQNGAFIFKNVKNWFDALAAYYPTCGDNNLVSPQLILIGENDGIASHLNCKSWEKHGNTNNLSVHYFPDATHSYDDSYLKKTTVVRRGGKVKYNKSATIKSHKLMVDFFEKHLRYKSMTYSEIQTALNNAGFNVGIVDGQFGKKSVSALKGFQSKNDIEPNGVLNQATQKVLMETK